MYVGHYGYPPNTDAILYFCREILPLIRQKVVDVQLVVVGDEPPAELAQYEGVKIAGFVPDVQACMADTDVIIAPLRIGGGRGSKLSRRWD